MSGFASSSSRSLPALLLLLAACVDQESVHDRTTSLRVTVNQPADLGSDTARLPDSVRDVSLTIEALDYQGETDVGFVAPVDVYVHTLGGLTPTTMKVDLRNGIATTQLRIPTAAFGRTFVWVEDVIATPLREATFATGTSPAFWYREPFLRDVSTPSPGSTSSQLRFSPLTDKQVRISASVHGAQGKLLVTGVYSDGYTLSDVHCAGTPCTASPFHHVYVFSFGRPVDVRGRAVQVGQTISWVEGGVAEFNGFTELDFPSQEIADETPNLALLPVPVDIDREWLRVGGPMQNLLRMEEYEAGLMAVNDVTVCPLDEDYDRFKQWKVNIGLNCGLAINVITSGTVSSFDPAAFVGEKIPRIVGSLRAVNFSGFNVWILLPRSASDLVLE